MKFMNQQHEERYASLIKKDETDVLDFERRSLFYIIAGELPLYELVEKIYDFPMHLLNTKGLEEIEKDEDLELSNETLSLLHLAKDLYTAIREKGVTEIFGAIDHKEKFQLAIHALEVRFNKTL